MKRLLVSLALLVVTRGLRAEALALRVHEQTALQIAGVTAAYVIDPTVAEVVVTEPGRVMVTGTAVGSTQLVAVTATATLAYVITVAPEKSYGARAPGAETPVARYGSKYSSEVRQLQNSFDVFMRDAERLSEIHLINVHYFRDTLGQARTSFPFASYHVKTPRREYTLLDDYVDVSPLTLQGTQVRGIHWLEGGLELHAGYSAPSMYEGLFLPVDRRWVAGAGYSIRRGPWKLTPTLYGFFSQPVNSSARRGVVASLISEYQPNDRFFARSEVAAGRSSVGGSSELRYSGDRDQGHLRVVYKPENFPTLGIADLLGTHAEGFWNRRQTERLTLTGSSSFDKFHLLNADQRNAFGALGIRYALTHALSALTGVEVSDVRAFSTRLRSTAIPAGLTYDRPYFGAGVLYRFIENSGASRRGDSLRVSLRAGGPATQFSVWGERQHQAPTLDLIFRQDPDLATALLRLGISVRSPEDLARVLRENAILINLGFVEGVTVNLAPRHTLGGLDFSWLSPFQSRDRLALHGIFDRAEEVRQVREIAIATLTYSRRLVGSSDIYGALTRWRSRTAGLALERTSYEVGIRADVSRVPALFQRRGPIEGVVFVDPEMRGVFNSTARPLEGIVVTLDGVESARSDKNGHFLFRGVSPGTHRVVAHLPSSPAAFFTTPSKADVEAGSRADFGLVWSPARLSGRVASDANVGIAGAVVVVTAGSGAPIRATSDGSGNYRLDLPAGDYKVDLAPESLPAGYALAGETQRSVHLVADQPVRVTFEVRALRSISGVSAPGAEIEMVPLGKKTVADATGAFVFRSLPAGTFKVVARSGGRETNKMVVLPDEPAAMHDVNLMFATATRRVAASPMGSSVTAPSPVPRREEGRFVVQVGAFREGRNAAQLVQRLHQIGVEAYTTVSNGLTVVRVGPFAARQSAEELSARLRKARFDTLIVPR